MYCCISKSALCVIYVYLTALVLPLSQAFKPSYNYCEPSLCKPNQNHVACGVHGKYGEACGPEAGFVTILSDLKQKILHRFNEIRNDVASGIDSHYPAAQMVTLSWDDELAYLARLNVRECQLHSDKCRNTKTYKNVGQALAYRATNFDDPIAETISHLMTKWYSERETVTLLDIMEYRETHGPKNFLHMVVESADKVGCAILQQLKNHWLQTFFTCNFANGLIVHHPVYTNGLKAAQNCTKINPEFQNLCGMENQPIAAQHPIAKEDNDLKRIKKRMKRFNRLREKTEKKGMKEQIEIITRNFIGYGSTPF